MSEACTSASPWVGPADMAALARSFETTRDDRRGLLRSESGILVDRHLSRLARCRGALDVAIGEGLRALDAGGRLMRFGYAALADYAAERLGIPGSTAQKMVRFAGKLRERPLLRAAVWVGDITVSQAEAIMPLARGEAEGDWVSRGRADTVRGLRVAVKAAGAEQPEEEEEWDRICLPMSPETKVVFDGAMKAVGRALRATTPKWERLEVILQEFIGSHPAGDPGQGDGFLRAPVQGWVDPLQESLEKDTARWAFLDRIDPVAAPVPNEPVMDDPVLLDEELRRLVALRNGWDESFGRFALLSRGLGLWRDAGFASFPYYCAERLGLSVRAVEQRIALERRLQVLPALRQALIEGCISYERARIIAWKADEATIAHWIGRAQALTCVELRREVESREEAQMSARGQLEMRVPRRVAALLADAIQAARADAGRFITPDECLRRIAQHFLDVWGPALERKKTLHSEILERDGGVCQVPRCSRAADHAHHVKFRAAGGSNRPENLVGVCAAHHLRGIHEGWIRVRGTAPDQLVWEIDGEVLRKGPSRKKRPAP